MGKHEDAIVCFDKAIEIDPKDGVIWNNKADTLMLMPGRLDDALQIINKAVELSPNDHITHETKGQILEKMGNKEESEKCFKRSKELKNE